MKIQKEFGIIYTRFGGDDVRQERQARGEPHAKEQQFHESDSFGHKKVQNDKIHRKNSLLNLISENSCLFVVIPYIFPLCRRLSAVAFVKADVFVAMSQLCKTKPIC